jgi:hypothetical protein
MPTETSFCPTRTPIVKRSWCTMSTVKRVQVLQSNRRPVFSVDRGRLTRSAKCTTSQYCSRETQPPPPDIYFLCLPPSRGNLTYKLEMRRRLFLRPPPVIIFQLIQAKLQKKYYIRPSARHSLFRIRHPFLGKDHGAASARRGIFRSPCPFPGKEHGSVFRATQVGLPLVMPTFLFHFYDADVKVTSWE